MSLHETVPQRGAVWLTAASAAVFAACIAAAWVGWRSDYARAWDLPVYAGYGERVTKGEVPYRDFRLEYPPGALPVFVVPALDLLSGDDDRTRVWEPVDDVSDSAWRYAGVFAVLMAVAGIGAIVATSASLATLGRPLGDWLLAHALLATSPLVLGGLLYTRYDLLPTALGAAALALALRGRAGWSGATLGLATAAKLFPLLLAPLLGAFLWRARGRREAVRGGIALALTIAVCFLPFLAAAPGGVWDSLREQGTRGLQAESTPASLLVAATRGAWKLGALDDLPMRIDEGEVGGLVTAEIRGPGVAAGTVVSTLLVAAAVLLAWARAVRRPLPADELVRLCAIVLVALLALGRVLSPQFVIWLLPFVPLVAGRRGRIATIVLAAVLALTHVWFPDVYRDYVNLLDAPSTALLVMRNALLVAVLAALVWPTRRREAPA
ncbi:MAG TPA: glycosyltransferase 87 family protein [Gaiella sp.]